jgi:hypothetical protein
MRSLTRVKGWGLSASAADPVAPFWTQQRKAIMWTELVQHMSEILYQNSRLLMRFNRLCALLLTAIYQYKLVVHAIYSFHRSWYLCFCRDIVTTCALCLEGRNACLLRKIKIIPTNAHHLIRCRKQTHQHHVKTGGLLLTISSLSTITFRLLPS